MFRLTNEFIKDFLKELPKDAVTITIAVVISVAGWGALVALSYTPHSLEMTITAIIVMFAVSAAVIAPAIGAMFVVSICVCVAADVSRFVWNNRPQMRQTPKISALYMPGC